MDIKQLRKGCALALVVYFALSLLFFWIAGNQLHFRDEKTDMLSASSPVGELLQGTQLRQPFVAEADSLRGVSLFLSTFARNNDSKLTVQIIEADGDVLTQATVSAETLSDNAVCEIWFSSPAELETGNRYELVLLTPDAVSGNGVSAWYGNAVSTSRAEIPLEIPDGEKLRVNGQPGRG